jgi:hypothetical protein
MPVITINGNSIDPEAAHRRVLGLQTQNPGSKYILIQTKAPLTKQQKQELSNMNVQVLEYVADDTYLCSCEVSQIDAL